MKQWQFWPLCLLLCCAGQAPAQVLQNMVRNPSFEQYKMVPQDLGNLASVDFWTSPTKASPDYFHRRAGNNNVDVPLNKMGRCQARTGYAYAGIYAYTNRYVKENFREYVQVELKQPLRAGDTYCVKAHVFLAQSSNRAVAFLGMMASPIRLNHPHELSISGKRYALTKTDGTPLNQRAWVEISCQYKARGGERYLILGNFEDDRGTRVSYTTVNDTFANPHVDFAYYYVDDICITNARTNFSCDCGSYDLVRTRGEQRIVMDFKTYKKEYALGQVVIMHGVEFESGKTSLLKGSQRAIEDLVATMRMHPNYHVEIS